VAERAVRVIDRLRAVPGNVLLFSSGHFLRVLAARWMGLNEEVGRNLFLGTSALSILGYEHQKTNPVLRLWNDVSHVTE
jgi:probable phosphoglycerate mutase